MEDVVAVRARRRVCSALASSAAVLLLGGPAQAQEPVVPNAPTAPISETAPLEPAATPPVSSATVDDVAVIVHKSNPITTLSMLQLRKIVLAQAPKWPGGGKILVWMTSPGRPERTRMLKVVCGMSETDLTLYFLHASFDGERADPPKTAGSGALVREAIAAAVNGMGFTWASEVDGSVKVVSIDGVRPGQAAYKTKVR